MPVRRDGKFICDLTFEIYKSARLSLLSDDFRTTFAYITHAKPQPTKTVLYYFTGSHTVEGVEGLDGHQGPLLSISVVLLSKYLEQELDCTTGKTLNSRAHFAYINTNEMQCSDPYL